MIKNKLNYRLVNIALTCVIIYLVYKSRNFWLIILRTTNKIFLPFMSAFFVAYIFYPFLNFLIKKKIPKILGILLIIFIVIGIFVICSIIICPSLFSEITSLINYIITFINQISLKYNINFFDFEEYLYELIKYLGKYFSDSAVSIVNYLVNSLIKTFVTFTLSIYFLSDMDKIRNIFKKFIIKRNYRSFDCLKIVDNEMNKYFIAFLKLMAISFFEYTIVYMIIGHPNAIMLGILVSIFGVIPYIGGIITNIIAAITAFTIGPQLFIKTLISFMILSIVDGYIINPLVYGKSNQIHPLFIIFAVATGEILGGIAGMIISLPIAIILSTIIKFYHNDFNYIKNKVKNTLK